MKTLFFLFAFLGISASSCSHDEATIVVERPRPEPEPNVTPEIGRWTFDQANDLLAAKKGLKLELVGTHVPTTGPTTTNGAVQIGPGSYYKIKHGIKANGGGSYVNQYSLMFDIALPDHTTWKALFNANSSNSNDAECFIKPQGNIGLGATGYTEYALMKDEWYRVVVTVGLGSTHRYYIDGQLAKEGEIQGVDGGFSLDDILLLFADNDGEDGLLKVAEVAMWDCVLTADEVANLDGYGHDIPAVEVKTEVIPYLQQPDENSMVISWHDIDVQPQSVVYGVDANLGSTQASQGEVIVGSYIWQTAKLTGLKENTTYYYQIKGKKGESKVHQFKTQPGIGKATKIRFLVLGDTQENPDITTDLIARAKRKLDQLYGSDLHNQLNFVIHTGDLVHSGSTIAQYTQQFFTPMAPLSSSVPCLITPGNHELEHAYFYKYIHNDDISGSPSGHANFERYWSKQVGNSLFIGLNSTKMLNFKEEQKVWLKKKLDEAESNPTIDFVFGFVHEVPFSEMWGQGKNDHVAHDLLPLFRQYSKSQQLTYGHVHAYERGVVESRASNAFGDISILAAGGGGGTRDRWGEYENIDYPEINMTVDHHFYVIGEIDVTRKSYKFETYSLGNKNYPQDDILIDSWERSLEKAAPAKPVANANKIEGSEYTLQASAYVGTMPLFSSQFELSEVEDDSYKPLISEIRDIRNIYGIGADFAPTDKNAGLNIEEYTFDKSGLVAERKYVWRIRYRDTNRRWSEWSDYKKL